MRFNLLKTVTNLPLLSEHHGNSDGQDNAKFDFPMAAVRFHREVQ